MNKKGRLIVIEGTDGSGKKTQTDMLANALRSKEHRVATLSFPSYGEQSAYWVEKYLNGELGTSDDIDPYLASMFYALDRKSKREKIEKLLQDNDFVILDRYVDSNAAHQGAKITDEYEREQYLSWLYKTEFFFFGIPEPHVTFILRVPAKTAQELVGKKEKRDYIKSGTHDVHEKDINHLRNAEAAYIWLAEKQPKNHVLIECTQKGTLLPIDEITRRILAEIAKKRLI